MKPLIAARAGRYSLKEDGSIGVPGQATLNGGYLSLEYAEDLQ